jgi:hypothetical protein
MMHRLCNKQHSTCLLQIAKDRRSGITICHSTTKSLPSLAEYRHRCLGGPCTHRCLAMCVAGVAMGMHTYTQHAMNARELVGAAVPCLRARLPPLQTPHIHCQVMSRSTGICLRQGAAVT